MTIIETHIVPQKINGIRLSDYAIGIFETIPTRKGIKKAIKKGAVCINGQIASTGRWVESGQVIQLIELETTPAKVYCLSLPVLYEDEEIALINKPAGIVVSGNYFRTIQNALPFNLTRSKSVDALSAPLPAHRLDSPTSGILLIAKTRKARRILGEQFEKKIIKKQYQAIVIGKPPQQGNILQAIHNKSAHTDYWVLKTVTSLRNKHLSLVELHPITGRTHQLRIHLAQLGYPILGDKLYGKKGQILKGKGLFLCAIGLQFIHPITAKKMDFKITAPKKFKSYLNREQKRWERYFG